MFCPNCGSTVDDNVSNCPNCGASINGQQAQQTTETQQVPNSNVNASNGKEPKSKLVAGLLGIFLGGIGVHNFYLGYKRNAIIQVCLTAATIITCGLLFPCAMGASIWGLVEGIFILTGKIKTDASGVPLKE